MKIFEILANLKPYTAETNGDFYHNFGENRFEVETRREQPIMFKQFREAMEFLTGEELKEFYIVFLAGCYNGYRAAGIGLKPEYEERIFKYVKEVEDD